MTEPTAPAFAGDVADAQDRLGRLAIDTAQRFGTTEPVTFPVNTPWDSWTQRDKAKDSQDWWMAVGGFSFNQTGQVTVRPPAGPGEPWRYEITTRINLRDPYDWAFPRRLAADHAVMTMLHQQGLAHDFLAYGASELRSRTGVVTDGTR